jgi:hypothetical protein
MLDRRVEFPNNLSRSMRPSATGGMDECGGSAGRPAPHRPGPRPGLHREGGQLGLPELRTRREEAEAEEAEEADVSYLRRLLQGRLDILPAELVRRSAGGEQDVAGLLAGLPAILTDDSPGTFSAVPRVQVPSRAGEHRRRVERRAVQRVVDVLRGELARRYRDGTAQVSQLLE